MSIRETTAGKNFFGRWAGPLAAAAGAGLLICGASGAAAANAAPDPSTGVTNVYNNADLAVALAAVRPGETIGLAPGIYNPVIRYTNVNFKITSLNASTPATIQTLKVYGSSGITFTNLTFDLTGVPMDPSTGWYTTAFQVTLSSNLTFTNLIVHGNLNGTLATDISGFLIRQSSNINVTHSDFSHMHYAIDQIENNGMLIQANNFHDLRDDGVRGGGTSNIVVDSNHCYSNHPDGPADTDHPDCIQFWTQGVTHPVSNITVTNNRYDVGTGFPTQFIFFGNETNQLFNNVTIRGNTAFGSLWRAVSVTYAANVTIQNNNLTGPCIVYPGVGQIITPWVSTKNVNGATVSGNTADLVFSEGGDTNVAYSGNTLVGCVH